MYRFSVGSDYGPLVLDLLLERVGDESQYLLVLIQQQTGGKVTQALIREAG